MEIENLADWVASLEPKLDSRQKAIARDIIKELKDRIGFLLDVGLEYLSLDRSTKSLSGGESQRIRLATQIGSKLVNVLYILDEPSIGLHQRDNKKLIDSLMKLRDEGNSVLVVEHDEDMIRSADWLIDLGPGAGERGGKVLFSGTPKQIDEMSTDEVVKYNSLSLDYLKGVRKIEIPAERRVGNGKFLELIGASGNNLKDVDIKIPLGCFIGIAGVSGSGKSSLVNETLMPILSRHFYRSSYRPLPYMELKGIKNVDKLIEIDQSPIGRTPRSNPATYTNVFSDIRKLFEETPDAKIRGFKAGRFSFNVKGGRCEECKGAGLQIIEMNFLPSVHVKCKECNGKRYNNETLTVKYRGKSINDVLEMTISQACQFFESIPSIYQKIKALEDVGLGYVRLGQPSTTLSGGESQRVKLAAELSKRDTGNSIYILDEPTTGLHFEDVRVLLGVLQKLVDQGNTILIIEHNLDVLRSVDYIFDLGPEGGAKGGRIVAQGTPEELRENPDSVTGKYL
ncbi:UvrABC system protein A [bioreactor metagenome]|uniref:UvrABC system protein A n=1 Tax=bioreactor metagenome TaxID=1076179 RepID=A0A644ZBF0_9ZZZZ